MNFEVNVDKLSWINGNADDAQDLCVHGHAWAQVGDETLEYDATVSAAALYLLRSIKENHIMGEGENMFPCCGFAMYARDQELQKVDIVGCPNGVDWSVIHEGKSIRVVTANGNEAILTQEEYQKIIYAFADKIEKYYNKCSPKELPKDSYDRDGYIAFWNEWHSLREVKEKS